MVFHKRLTQIAKRLVNSALIRDFLTLAGGTAASQLIVFAASPLLTRLYEDTAFGLLTLSMSAASILAVFIGGKYSRAILLARNSSEAKQIFWSALIFSVIVFLPILFVSVVFEEELVQLVAGDIGANFIFLTLGLSLFIAGYNAVYDLANYNKTYKLIAASSVAMALVRVAFSILFFLGGIKSLGLLFGFAISRFIGIFHILVGLRHQLRDSVRRFWQAKSDVLYFMRRFKAFPLINAPTAIIHNLSLHAPVFIVAAAFSVEETGQLGLALMVIGLPATLISKGASDLFFQRASAAKLSARPLTPILVKILGLTTVMVLPVAVILIIFGPVLFQWVFGNQWHLAGEMARWLAVAMVLQLPVVSVLTIFEATEELGLFGWLRIAYALLVIVALIYLLNFGLTVTQFIAIYAILKSFLYLVFLGFALRSAVRHDRVNVTTTG